MAKMRIMETRQVSLQGESGNQGIYWTGDPPSSGDIDIDNDGVYNPALTFIADLSEIASQVLGRQVSMTSPVVLHGIQIGIRPVDDVADNDESAFFAGEFRFQHYTSHVQKALSLARQMEKFSEGGELDADSFFLSTTQDYSGLRYGLDFNNEIRFQTAGWPAGGDYTWTKIRDAYNAMTAPVQDNALFAGRCGELGGTQWVCSLASGVGVGDSPPPGGASADWQVQTRQEILPFVQGLIRFSSSDEDGAVDDDYRVWVTVDYSVEV
jgi:hypothetical protein